MDGGEEWMSEANSAVSGQGIERGNKRRFSDDQVRLLEMMFEEETKLEPKKKLQEARELGLQPRQVAIWFQNRRARWKSKHLEREYSVLKANYDALAQSFDSLKKEKQSLLKQVKKLSEILGKEDKRSRYADYANTDNSKDGLASKFTEPVQKPQKSLVAGDHGFSLSECSFDESSINCIEGFHPEGSGLTATVDLADADVKWPESWAELDSGSFSDQSCCTMDQSWNFWP